MAILAIFLLLGNVWTVVWYGENMKNGEHHIILEHKWRPDKMKVKRRFPEDYLETR